MNLQSIKKTTTNILWFVMISFFSFLMFSIIWPYTSWARDVDFLLTKQMIIHLDHYRLAFYTHIFSSLIILFSGAFLFSNTLLRHYPKVHQYAGRVYVSLLLFLSAPSGFILAYYANGDWMASLSFLLLTPLWWWVTFKGYQTIRRGEVNAHRNWMIRSYALTLSAISLRIYQMSFPSLFIIDPILQYTLVSWLSWTGNLVIAEYLIYRRTLKWKALLSSYKSSKPKKLWL